MLRGELLVLAIVALASVECAKSEKLAKASAETTSEKIPGDAAVRGTQNGAPATPAPRECFDVRASRNGRTTRAVFASRSCQGGGPTWAAILGVLIRRRGRVEPVHTPPPGWLGNVKLLNGKTLVSVDDEADGALVCTNDAEVLAALRADYAHVNDDATAIRKAMSESTALELECFEEDGSRPRLPIATPPPKRPAHLLAAEDAERKRLKATLQKQPTWCFPPHDLENMTGTLHFFPGGRVSLTTPAGKAIGRGVLNWPSDDSGDTRVEILITPTEDAPAFRGTLLHLDLGPTGRIGFNAIGKTGTLREDLLAGDECAPPAKSRPGG